MNINSNSNKDRVIKNIRAKIRNTSLSQQFSEDTTKETESNKHSIIFFK